MKFKFHHRLHSALPKENMCVYVHLCSMILLFSECILGGGVACDI